MPSMIAASSRPATSRSSLLLGAAAAAAGAGEAAMGVFMAGQQIATGKYLSYTRSEEEAADAAGAKFLSGAGISGRGSVEFFHKLLNQETRAGFRASDEARSGPPTR
jgi:predicted Zn-dependent protease